MVDICVHPEFLSQSETVPGLIAVNTEDRGKLKLITVRFYIYRVHFYIGLNVVILILMLMFVFGLEAYRVFKNNLYRVFRIFGPLCKIRPFSVNGGSVSTLYEDDFGK